MRARLTRLVLLSPNDGWAVGDLDTVTGAAEVLHFDGSAWRPVSDGKLSGLTLTAVGGTSTGGTWVAGIREVGIAGPDGQSAPVVLHFDGAHWTQQPIQADGSSGGLWIADLAMLSPTDGWAVGTVLATASSGGGAPLRPPSAVVLRYQAGAWTQVARYIAPAGAPQCALHAVSVAAGGNGWAVGTAGLRVRIHNGQITPAIVPYSAGGQPDLWSITLSSSGNGWSVGDAGNLLSLGADGWHRYGG
jgi:hypothetical protein